MLCNARKITLPIKQISCCLLVSKIKTFRVTCFNRNWIAFTNNSEEKEIFCDLLRVRWDVPKFLIYLCFFLVITMKLEKQINY